MIVRVAGWLVQPLALTVFAALLLASALTWPVLLDPTRLLYGYPGDATGTVGYFWWWSYAIKHGQPLLDNRLVGVPMGSGWNLVPFTPLQVGILAPLSVLLGPVATYNAAVLSSYPLTAGATWLAARRLGMAALPAAFAALAYAFMPYHTEKAQAHVMQAHMEFLPAFLYFALRWRQGGSPWILAGTGAAAGLTLWNDTYMAYVLLVMAAAVLLVSLALPREPGDGWWPRLRAHGLALLIAGGVAALFVPVWLLLAARAGGGYGHAVAVVTEELRRSPEELRVFSARPWEYVLPWHANPLVPAPLRDFEVAHLHGSNFIENTQFLGYTVLLLAAVGLAAAIAGRRWFPAATTLGIIAAGAWFSMPPVEHVGRLTITFPSGLLLDVLPVFRVYARFGMAVMLGAALLAGLGLEAWRQRWRARGGRWLALTLIPFLTLAVEFTNTPPPRTTAVLPAPAEYTWLRSQPAGILVEYPLDTGNVQVQERETRQYSMYQMVHEHAMFNGAATASPAGKYAQQLEPYYAPATVARLQGLGIHYVFVHRTDYRHAGLDTPESVAGLQFVATIDDTNVFLVQRGP